ncbi:hypothetical protein E2562_024658 [Oryza meyeriana var. granulata]|uniref:Secreted protein n=1 Tax=Oryza meyeriana var. granulata TaxID=110450 RepID=A0A6G1EAE4_9ORYZ|nr:hypothetical protein E2562_024658 [Oryza meyeriana var. granulata]
MAATDPAVLTLCLLTTSLTTAVAREWRRRRWSARGAVTAPDRRQRRSADDGSGSSGSNAWDQGPHLVDHAACFSVFASVTSAMTAARG